MEGKMFDLGVFKLCGRIDFYCGKLPFELIDIRVSVTGISLIKVTVVLKSIVPAGHFTHFISQMSLFIAASSELITFLMPKASHKQLTDPFPHFTS